MSKINYYETGRQYQEKKRKKYEAWRKRFSFPHTMANTNAKSKTRLAGSTSRIGGRLKKRDFENDSEKKISSPTPVLSDFIDGSIRGFDTEQDMETGYGLNGTIEMRGPAKPKKRPTTSLSRGNVKRKEGSHKRKPKSIDGDRGINNHSGPSSSVGRRSEKTSYDRMQSLEKGWNDSFIHDTPIANYQPAKAHLRPYMERNINRLIGEVEKEFKKTRISRKRLESRTSKAPPMSSNEIDVLMADLLHDDIGANNVRDSRQKRQARSPQGVRPARRSQSAHDTRRRVAHPSQTNVRLARPQSAHPSRRRSRNAPSGHDLPQAPIMDWSTFCDTERERSISDILHSEETTFDDCKMLIVELWEHLGTSLSFQEEFVKKHFSQWSALNEAALLSHINRLLLLKSELVNLTAEVSKLMGQQTEEDLHDPRGHEQSTGQQHNFIVLRRRIHEWLQSNNDLYGQEKFLWKGKNLVEGLATQTSSKRQSKATTATADVNNT